MKDKILKLRAQGKTYNEIKSVLGCSKGTISFHCGKDQKKKSNTRLKKYRGVFRNYIKHRIYFFQKRDDKNKNFDSDKPLTFSIEDFFEKFGEKTRCALTGVEIDLLNTKDWDIDHIVPKSKGGSNSLDNCQILLRDINMMKHKLTEEELINYCKLILNYKMRDSVNS